MSGHLRIPPATLVDMLFHGLVMSSKNGYACKVAWLLKELLSLMGTSRIYIRSLCTTIAVTDTNPYEASFARVYPEIVWLIEVDVDCKQYFLCAADLLMRTYFERSLSLVMHAAMRTFVRRAVWILCDVSALYDHPEHRMKDVDLGCRLWILLHQCTTIVTGVHIPAWDRMQLRNRLRSTPSFIQQVQICTSSLHAAITSRIRTRRKLRLRPSGPSLYTNDL
ncbi:hypothetical protein M422DRAFT_254073 [Sphaerobolus stellatus SS14]|uniref:Uncharacterized protein n=1 Tax=Sphaerobolus stellatus (strain SS14) TaxID=990650 RepID=A0A0C9UHR4_SPHS4|nr:hypothetical protein M422DRAFT_254073 [Sphaerobolus stellatus SS14]